MEFYVVGIPQTGGCWTCTGKAYTKWANVKAALEKDRAANIDYTRIFTFWTKDDDEPTTKSNI